MRLRDQRRVGRSARQLLLAPCDLVRKAQGLADQLAQGDPFRVEAGKQLAPGGLQELRPRLARERRDAGDQRRAPEGVGTAVDGIDFLRQLRSGGERAAKIAGLLQARDLLPRRGGDHLLEPDRPARDQFRRGLRGGQRRERLRQRIVERLVPLLELLERTARVRVTAVLVEHQRLEDERFREEPLLEERRVQGEEVSQRLLVFAAAEMGPARLEERVEPLRSAAAHPLVEARREHVVSILVREPRQLQPGLVAPLGPAASPRRTGKIHDSHELPRGVARVSRRQRREPRHFARIGLRRIAGRNGSGERAGEIQLALRHAGHGLSRLRRLHGRSIRGRGAHLTRELLVERPCLGAHLRGRSLLRHRLERGAFRDRREPQRQLQMSAGDRHRDGSRQLAGIALLRDQELRQGAIAGRARREPLPRRGADAVGLRRVRGEGGEQHRRAVRHGEVLERLHDRRDARARLVRRDPRAIDLLVRGGRVRRREQQCQSENHPGPPSARRRRARRHRSRW